LQETILERRSKPLFSTKFSVALVVSALSAATASSPALAQKPLTVREIYAHGSLTGKPPAESNWSPDGRMLTYMDAAGLEGVDAKSGTQSLLLSAAEIAALTQSSSSEKDKDHRDRYHMASYLWTADGKKLLFDAAGALWLYDIESKESRKVADSGLASGDDPQFSPDGGWLSFLKGNSLSVVSLKEADAKAAVLAQSPGEEILKGNVDWVYEEELGVRSNIRWAPDSAHLAFLEMNESRVPKYPLTDWIPQHSTVDWQRYPQPGDPDPEVRVGVVPVTGGETVWVKIAGFKAGDDSIPRFGWADGRTVWVETLSRDQRRRAIYFADAATGESRLALELMDPKFHDEQYDVWVGHGSIVLKDWRDGHNHLYLYHYDPTHPAEAKLGQQLTSGNFEVLEVGQVNLEAGRILFTSTEGSPMQAQIWRLDLKGDRKQLSTAPGWHTASFAPSGDAWSDKHSRRSEPPVLEICTAAGCKSLWQPKSLAEWRLHAPQQFTVKAADGTTLYATLLMPENAKGAATVPLIVNPYGGPGAQTVQDSWSDALLFDQILTDHGFAVLHADNRGMGNRGREFAQASWRNFGPVQFEDQMAIVEATLKAHSELDPKRLGWWGWSWGGSFTLYSMTHSDRFKAGVSVAPVTEWHNYDSIYTERYMDQPAATPETYRVQSVVNSAANLKGHLLMVHGTGDDNVHPSNTIQFVQKLIEADKPYDLQLYPRKTHSIAGADVRIHLYERILHHFEQYLMPAE